MKPIKPLVPIKQKNLDEVALALLKNPPENEMPAIAKDITNPEDYLILEGRTHKSYTYPNLYVAINRLGYSPEVETASKSLNLNLKNMAKEQNGHEYIGKINWQEALKLNLTLGNQTLTTRQGIDLLLDLRQGIDRSKTIYDARGKAISRERLKNMYNEIIEVRNPYRGEWLDADFKVVNDVLYIYYGHYLNSNGELAPNKSVQLENCLMEDCKVDLTSCNLQGMPTRKGRGIIYGYPRKDNISVAWLYADSDWAGLDCVRDPSNWDVALGVRSCRLADAKNSGGGR